MITFCPKRGLPKILKSMKLYLQIESGKISASKNITRIDNSSLTSHIKSLYSPINPLLEEIGKVKV